MNFIKFISTILKSFAKIDSDTPSKDITVESPNVSGTNPDPQPEIQTTFPDSEPPISEFEPSSTPTPESAVTSSVSVAKSAETARLDSKIDYSDRYVRKQIRRKIVSEFAVLRGLGNECTPQQIAEFIFRHYDNLELMREALSPEKHSEKLAAILIWHYLAEEASGNLDQIYLEQKMRVERQSWFEGILKEPITIQVTCTESGPRLQDVSIEALTSLVRQMLNDSLLHVTFLMQEPITHLGDYKISLELSTGDVFKRTLNLVPYYRDVTVDNLDEIKRSSPVSSKVGENPVEWLEMLLAEQTSDDFIENFHGLTNVLATAFHLGYWLLPWTQELLQDWQSQVEIVRKGPDVASEFGVTLSKILEVPYPYGRGTIVSEIIKRIRAAANIVKRDIARVSIDEQTPIPVSKFGRLIKDTKSWRLNGLTDGEIADRYLRLVKAYIHNAQDSFATYCLAEYCFYKGELLQQQEKSSEARPYLYIFLLLHSQSTLNIQRELSEHYYLCLTYFFRSFNLPIQIPKKPLEGIDWFYPALYEMIRNKQKNQRELGYCLLGLAIVAQGWVLDLVNRLKQRTDRKQVLKTIVAAIQNPAIFISEPYHSMQLLARIDSAGIPVALSALSSRPPTTEQRRLVAIALLRLTNTLTNGAESLVSGLSSLTSSDTLSIIGFSLLVEPFILNIPEKEAEMKANLLVEAYGFPNGITSTEVFQGRMKDLATLFDRFNRAQDPNLKGRFGTTIQDTIRLTRRYLAENVPTSRSGSVFFLFRGLEGHVTTELAKLIHDTRLEIAVVNDRALYTPNNTRVIIEIRNVGEGIADGLELEVNPVKEQYDVDDWHRKQTIESLSERAVEQREVFIVPRVGVSSNVDLDVVLRYNTLKEKDKVAELSTSQRTVWLYPETEFVRVRQAYNFSEPATALFYGRHDMLQSMADNLSPEPGGLGHNTSMIVYGLKRAGKTSVVKRFMTHTLRERHLDELYIPVYLDFLKDVQINEIESDTDFLRLLIQTLARALKPEQRSVIVEDSLLSNPFEAAPFKEFSSLLEQILRALDGRRILLVLDEFSQLGYRLAVTDESVGLSSRVFSFLSNTLQSTNQLAFVFTGTYILNEMMREHAFDLAKICTPKLISFLDDNSARRLVTEPVALDKSHPEQGYLEFHSNVVDRIVTVTNRHPYLVQYLCHFLVDRMNSDIKHPQVNLNDINTVIREVVSRPSHDPAFLSFWKDFDVTQRKILAIVAEELKRNPFQPWVNIDEIIKVFHDFQDQTSFEDILRWCTSLEDAEMLERSPAGDEAYRISIPLYQEWLSQNRSVTALFGDIAKE